MLRMTLLTLSEITHTNLHDINLYLFYMGVVDLYVRDLYVINFHIHLYVYKFYTSL